MKADLVRFLLRAAECDPAVAAPGAHVDENTLALAVDGLLSADHRAELLAHVAACPACRRRLSLALRDEALADAAQAEPRHLNSITPSEARGGAERNPPRAERGGPTRSPARDAAPEAPRPWRIGWAAPAAIAAVLALATLVRFERAELTGASRSPARVTGAAVLTRAGADLLTLGVQLDGSRTRGAAPGLPAAAYDALSARLAPRIAADSAAIELLTRAALSARRYEAARRHAERWIAAAATQPPAARAVAHNALGLAWSGAERFEPAVVAFEAALQLDAANPAYQLNAGVALARSGDLRRAADLLARWLPAAASHPERRQVERWLAENGR